MKQSIKNNIYFLKYVKQYTPLYFFLRFITVILSPVQPLISIFVMKIAIDSVVSGKTLKEMFTIVLIGFCIAIGSNLIIHGINTGVGLLAKRLLTKSIQGDFLKKAEKLDFSCFDDTEFYNKYTRALVETDDRCIKVFDTFINFLSKVITLITVIAVLSVLSPLVIVLCAALIIGNYALNKVKNKLDFQYNNNLTPLKRKMDYAKKIFYEPQYAQEIRMGKLGPLMRQKFDETIEEMLVLDRKYSVPNTFLTAGFNSIGYVLTFSVIAIACWQISAGILSVGGFAALLNGAEQLFMGFYGLLGSITEMDLHSKFIENFKYIIQYESKIEADSENKMTCSVDGDIEIKNVSFAYPKKEEYVLRNISMKIPRGKKIAIVGYNGAGKTTLVKLLLRLYDPTKGQILWNNEDYHSYDVADLRKHYSVVFQNYQCYALSIDENITFLSELNVEERQKLKAAIKMGGIYAKIETLPQKGSTSMSKEFDENGVPFSGGEQQKVAISRAFYEDRNVIIMDEPSSALDPIAEYEMNTNIKTLAKEKTVIMISHRLSTIRMFDEIYVMNQGEIIERGTHDELMNLKGTYAEMFTKQASNYKEDEAIE